MKPKQTISILLAALFIFVNVVGCFYTKSGSRLPERGYSETDMNLELTTEADKESSVGGTSGSINNIERNLNRIERELEYALPCEAYKPQIDAIYKSINVYNSGKKKTRKLVKKLYSDLGNEGDGCASDLRLQVKKFSYIRYEYMRGSYKVAERPTLNPFKYAFFVFEEALYITLLPVMLIFTTNSFKGRWLKRIFVKTPKRLWVSKSRKLERDYYRKIRINPYYGTETFIGREGS